MADIKKYLGQEALSALVTQVKAEDAKTLQSAKDYCDGKDKNFESAGAAAQALADAKSYTDEKVAPLATTEALNAVDKKVDDEVARAKAEEARIVGLVEATDAIADKAAEDIATLAQTHATDKATLEAKDTELAQAIANLDTYVGDIPVVEGQETPATVIEYINKKTEGIATDAALSQLQSDVDAIEEDVATIKGDYLKSSDKTELAEAIATEAETARAAEKANADAIKAISDDYLKAEDKEELQGNIDAVSAVANAAATKTALQEEVTRATGVEAGLRTDIDAVKSDYLKAADKTELADAIATEKERAEEVEASLQTQINTIMNNPDAEGAINSINEFTQYVEEHGEIAEGFRTSINENAEAIEDLEALVKETYETKEDATAKYDEVMAEVAAKAVQADWNQNDETAADYVKNRTHYEDVSYTVILEEMEITTSEGSWGDGRIASEELDDKLSTRPDYANGENLLITLNGESYELRFEQVERYDYAAGNAYLFGVNGQTDDGTDFAFHSGTDQQYKLVTREPGTYTLKIVSLDRSSASVKQLDEKFIPDTIARVADMEVVAGKVSTLEGQMTEVQGAVATKVEQEAYDAKVIELTNADTALDERLQAVEAQLGDGENSVSDLIETAKQEAIATAAEDAANKDVVVLAEAQKHADELNNAMAERVATLETASATHALASDVETLAGRVTTAEGEIDTLQSEMDAVEEKASTNETAIGTINTELAKKAAQTDLEAAVARIATNETAIGTINTTLADKAEQEDLDDAVERITAVEAKAATNESEIKSFVAITPEEVNALFA